ncbi:hypothetical protein AB0J90_02800 [Micromonospora sp. NPDC049523]|uniref:hypothetical protein n=1 Tax=Micromonospora sp. NPDC049523 TaxID=3155921 RepID=UPI0034146C53
MERDDDGSRTSDEKELTGELYDRYLARAEDLLFQADRQREGVRIYRALGVLSAVSAMLLALGSLVVAPGGTMEIVARLVVGGVVAVAGFTAVERWLVRPRLGLALRDEEAMVEAVTLLRDVHPLLAEQEQWDYVRERVSRARLSRFPIGLRRI